MALWFIRGLARGRVTTRYPAVRDPWANALPTPPAIVASLLTFEVAQRLVKCCPSRALVLEGRTLVLDVGACTACGECQRVAPEVVKPSGAFELATRSAANLVKRIPIQGVQT